MNRLKFESDINQNAKELNMRGVETIEVERPKVEDFDKVFPKIQGSLVKKINLDKIQKPHNKLLTIILENYNDIGSYDFDNKPILNEYMRETIEDIERFIMNYDIEDLITTKNINKCIDNLNISLTTIKNLSIDDCKKNLSTKNVLNQLDIFNCFSQYVQMKNDGSLKQYRTQAQQIFE